MSLEGYFKSSTSNTRKFYIFKNSNSNQTSMKKTLLSNLTFLLILFGFSLPSTAQMSISNPEEIANLKNGTTYFGVEDPSSERTKEYIEILKNNWTFNTIEVIPISELPNYYTPENSYFTIGLIDKNMSYTRTVTTPDFQDVKVTNLPIYHQYFEVWKFNDNYFKQAPEKRKRKDKYVTQIARLEIFMDDYTLANPYTVFQTAYSDETHLRSWGPGIFKNQIQELQELLAKNEKDGLYSKIFQKDKVEKLKVETLYVPDYIFVKRNKFNGNESERFEEKELMEGYGLKYQIISIEDLNSKILNGEEIYYLYYVRSNTDKYISIINSKTGEVIYSIYRPMSYNFSDKDMKILQKDIED